MITEVDEETVARTGTDVVHATARHHVAETEVGMLDRGETSPCLAVEERVLSNRQHRETDPRMLGNEDTAQPAVLLPKKLKYVPRHPLIVLL